MNMENKKIKKCTVCSGEIAKKAKVCPHCGAKIKKPFYKKGWFITLAIVVVIGAIAGSGSEDTKAPVSIDQNSTEAVATQQAIEYIAYDVSTLVDDLEANAMNAEEKYNKQYVEITGDLSNIDSDGKYISLMSSSHEFSFISVQCYIKNDEQKSQVATMKIGDTVTLRGKIKSVGEVLGYSLDIDSIN